jgi:alpha-beta hydrolase superfamily lysophospholipase
MLQSTSAVVLLGMAIGAAAAVMPSSEHGEPMAAMPTAEAVTMPMADGTTVNGRFVKSGDGRRGVVLFSMCRRDAIDGWNPVVEQLAAVGISSLAVTSPTPRPVAAGAKGAPLNSRATDADAIVIAAAQRLAPDARLAVGGGSCGVHLALLAATRVASVRAAVVLSGPYDDSLLARIAQLPGLAMFSGASRSEGPAIGWAEALRSASTHTESRLIIREGNAHGTDMFAEDAALTRQVVSWLADRLR